jgi:hypothetical protein
MLPSLLDLPLNRHDHTLSRYDHASRAKNPLDCPWLSGHGVTESINDLS